MASCYCWHKHTIKHGGRTRRTKDDEIISIGCYLVKVVTRHGVTKPKKLYDFARREPRPEFNSIPTAPPPPPPCRRRRRRVISNFNNDA